MPVRRTCLAAYLLIMLATLMAGVMILSATGCTEQERLEAERLKASVDLSLAEMRTDLAAAKARAATQPSEKLSQLIDEIDTRIAASQEISAQVQAWLDAAKTATPQGFLEPMRRLPYVGPYADLIILFATAGIGFLKRTQAQQQLDKLIAAWKAEEPAGPSPAMKAVLDGESINAR